MELLWVFQVIELHDVPTDGKELSPTSPQDREERRNSRTRDQFDYDRESMQDMELRDEDDGMMGRGGPDYFNSKANAINQSIYMAFQAFPNAV